MCNLYSLTTNRDAVIRLFKVSDNRAETFEPMSAIFPGYDAPIIRISNDGERELSILSWGFVLPQKDKAAKRVTNCRDDKAMTSRFWKSSVETRRCLVPVTSFSEPKGRSPAVWHWFALDDKRPAFAFAGIWRSFKGRLKPTSDPIEFDTYAFLTTTPNAVVKPIHPNRMPVMLVGEDVHDTWLNGDLDEALALAKPFDPNAMQVVAKGGKHDG